MYVCMCPTYVIEGHCVSIKWVWQVVNWLSMRVLWAVGYTDVVAVVVVVKFQ